MERFIVYLDDAEYARQHLAPLKDAATPAAHWVLVGCPPRLTRRIGKWLSHSAREQWRSKWAAKLFAQAVPALLSPQDRATTVLATGPLPALTRQLLAEHGVARVIDARRPKFGHDLAPVTPAQAGGSRSGWEVPGAVAILGAVLVLAAE